ncbi:Major facilitator superfamily domain,Major facilitator superfamily associated domain [Cinara cedri]|uniref:Major facilitator superfamily domain,Major facilitator superfamily associated domain n=1 Tax=Cinara cedri TaxID=506608 RepID=A0A5E4MVY7_9HEMI|nr:Major facilitator superfamily domain,Major facilitator superfamily associated domain [Cinara cedri]
MSLFRIDKSLLLMKMNYFFGIGGFSPYMPFLTTIARQRGYSAFVVGFMNMLQPIPGLVARPIIGALTDRYKCRRAVFITSIVLIFSLMCMLWVIPGKTSDIELNDLDVIKSPLFWWFSGTISLINALAMVKTVLEDTICVNLLGDQKNEYGKQRLWGSVGWSFFAIVSGVCVDWYSEGQHLKNYDPAFFISLLCFAIDMILVIQENDNTVMNSNVSKIFAEGKVIAFLLWVIMFGFFMSFVWNFVFWYLEDLSDQYHPETKSQMKTLQGLSLIVQCFAGEVPSFFLSNYVLKRVNQMTVFSLMFLMFTVGFSTYSFVRNPLWTLPIEIINGASFGMTFSAGISYATMLAPIGAEGFFQSMFSTAMYGVGAPVGSLTGGFMFKNLGSINSFRLLGLIAFVMFVSQTTVNYILNRLNGNEDTKDTYTVVAIEENAEKVTISA